MASILITWELGGGLGHLLPLKPVVRGLCEPGHRVAVALRDLARAGGIFGRDGVSYLQAPFRLGRVAEHVPQPRTFAQVLHNVGFADAEELGTLAGAWRNLFHYVRPDLILFDHSPTALLAARGYPARRAVIGIPFACPPDQYPLPDLRPWLDGNAPELRRDEDRVLERANRVLGWWGEPPLKYLAELYHPADETFLTTFAELDHYPGRNGARYWGVWPAPGGAAPEWPPGPGKKVYAYLNAFPGRAGLLALLAELRCPTLVYLDRNDAGLQKRFQAGMLKFARRPLDLAQVGRQCDLAILNAGHGTTAAMLLAGKPILQVPIYLEQRLNAAATERVGAGLSARPNRIEGTAVKLMALLSSEHHMAAARRFAERHGPFESGRQVDRLVRRIEELAA